MGKRGNLFVLRSVLLATASFFAFMQQSNAGGVCSSCLPPLNAGENLFTLLWGDSLRTSLEGALFPGRQRGEPEYVDGLEPVDVPDDNDVTNGFYSKTKQFQDQLYDVERLYGLKSYYDLNELLSKCGSASAGCGDWAKGVQETLDAIDDLKIGGTPGDGLHAYGGYDAVLANAKLSGMTPRNWLIQYLLPKVLGFTIGSLVANKKISRLENNPSFVSSVSNGSQIKPAPALGFANESAESFPNEIALAYASVLRTPPTATRAAFVPGWTAWGSGFGGYNRANGDPATGSNAITAHAFGGNAGMQYNFTRNTMLGFAFGGSGLNWGQGSNGSGRNNSLQFGVYGSTRNGPAYLGAWVDATTNSLTSNRVVPAGDAVGANYDAHSYGARLEGGYRYAFRPMFSVTPYAALQVQYFRIPSYSETDLSGGNQGVSYNAMSATDTRSELGLRFDKRWIFDNMRLNLNGRIAWAHDWISNQSVLGVFNEQPTTSFIVNAATPAKNSALTTLEAELLLTSNWSLAARFDGSFASTTQSYAGTGTLRFRW